MYLRSGCPARSVALARAAGALGVAVLLGAACAVPSSPTVAPSAVPPKPSEAPLVSPTSAAAKPAGSLAPAVVASPSPQSAAPLPSAGVAGAAVVGSFTLPDLPLAGVQNAVLPGSVQNDRRVLLGSISDLWRGPGDAPNEFWAVTDRGPNGEVKVQGPDRRTFLVPSFDPLIVRLRAEPGGTLRLVETIPLVGSSGKPVSGLPNVDGRDETPWDAPGRARLPFNPSGLDTEGCVRTSAGEFWLVEEYAPSLVRVDAEGRILKRYVPEGLSLPGADYPVQPSLPAIFARRSPNRGFEGVALSPDEKTLYLVLQSPLDNPNRQVGDRSRNDRIIVFDIASERVTAEYVYRLQPAAEFGNADPGEVRLSAAVAVGPSTLLLDERTDPMTKLYLAELNGATNILGSRWDDPATTPSLEALADPAAAGVTPLTKRLVVDLSEVGGVPHKIEGLAIVDPTTVTVANDNDFDFIGIDRDGSVVPARRKSQLVFVKLPGPLP